MNRINGEHNIELVLEHAKRSGATAVELTLGTSVGFSATVRGGLPESVEHARDQDFDITVFVGQKQGDASTTDLREASIKETVEKACEIAKVMADDPCNGLPDKGLMATNLYDLQLSKPHAITPADALDLAKACEEHALALDKRITRSDGVSFSTNEGRSWYANSHGFIGETTHTNFDLSCVLIAEKAGKLERDYDFDHHLDFTQLRRPEDIAEKAVEHTVSRLDSRKVKTQTAPVLFKADIAVGFLSQFFKAIAGSNLYRKSSFLLDTLGQSIFPSFIDIVERPHILGGHASTLFDADGVQTYDKSFIEKGVLQTYMLGEYSSRRLGLKTTANADGAHNVLVSHSDKSFHDLVQDMDTGLIVTEVMGQGVNIVTGDYSRGARGFWVEGGKIQYPVSEITIAGNLKDLFKHIVAIGNDIDRRYSIATGAILLESMTIAGA
jgi:PmbA protein